MEYIVAGIFVISLLVRGFRWLVRKTNPPQTPLAPPPSQLPQNPFQAAPPFPPGQAPFPGQVPFPGQAPPQPMRPAPLTQAQAFQQQQALQQRQQAARFEQARTQPRQPAAGGPAVPVETNRQDFVRQEQELFASEPAALGVSLTSSTPAAAAPNTLFGGTDDLVRAIILQEVLGPPLSRRKPSQPAPLP